LNLAAILISTFRGKKKRSGQPAMNRSKQAGMGNKSVVVLLVGLALATLDLAEAQQPAKVSKIGLLGTGSSSGLASLREVFPKALRELGYVEGKNIAIEYRYADNKLDRLPTLADELVRLKVDVLITNATSAALAAKNATRTIPTVFLGVSDPVAAGLVDSLARPGGNITGFTNIAAVLAGKRLELLKETVPKLSRVAVMWNPQDPGSALNWKESQLPGRELGLQLHSVEVSSVDEYESAFKGAVKARSGALAVSPLASSNLNRIADLAVKNRLPAMYVLRDIVDRGGLMSYGPNQTETFRRAAVFVDKILKGAKPADLPVEQPTKFEFVINLKAAKQIGLTIPPNLLARADKVIK
jgi:putative tryptophan/tyrosine transport system substrate-binding protein